MSAVAPETANVLVEKNPADRLTIYTVLWLVWVAAFFVIEGKALYDDAHSPDRRKRTLSSNLRSVFATDSVTGIPLDVPHGKLRRFVLITGTNWFSNHIQRTEFV